MCYKYKVQLLSFVLVSLFLLAFSVSATSADDIKNNTLSILESYADIFRKPPAGYKPIGLNVDKGFIKSICIGFNSGLHKMSQLEALPISFENPLSAEVPVLLYHHITTDKGYGDNVMSATMFEKHLKAIDEAGYTTVSAKEMIDFVFYGKSLPEKPILISFDDGYHSNYELAYPLLKKYNMKAIIFAIGWAIGKEDYKNTGKSIIPHFGYKEINEMTSSGLIEVQSHTYDMHQSPEYEVAENIRESVVKLENEDNSSYLASLKNDYKTFDMLLFNNTGFRNYAIAYPHGEYTEESEEVFKMLGCYITFTTKFSSKNTLVQGEIDSLRVLNRFTISESISHEQLIPMIESIYK